MQTFPSPFAFLGLELTAALDATFKASRVSRAVIAFHKLLMCRDARASRSVVALLHGAHGAEVSQAAWKAVAAGLQLLHGGYVSQAEPHYSLATLCVLSGTVATFEAVVLSGAPAVVPGTIMPSNLTEWMDLVATTNAERLTAKLEMMTKPDMSQHGVVGEIAILAEVSPTPAHEAFDVVWRLAPHHPGFHALSHEPSERGAAVRAFLMSTKIEQPSQMPPAEVRGSSPRRRRASV